MPPRLLLYNPENDLALAGGLERFTAPKAGRVMAEAGALLPLWWAEEGDEILADVSHESAARRLRERFGLCGSLGYRSAVVAEPWGWSAYARRKCLDAGMPAPLLPSVEAVERWRMLSHRRSSIRLLEIAGTEPELLPVEAPDVATALDAVSRFGRAVVKLPWSCSGRGVFFSRSLRPDELRRRLEGSIRRQGSVIVEPEYERVAEMAALFHAGEVGVEFRGMSMFRCDGRGAYGGNIVAPQEVIAGLCGVDAVETAHRMAASLDALLCGSYRGWLGVDMLRHRAGLCPCMELNLRMTMGVVAMKVADRLPRGTVSVVAGAAPAGAIDLSPTGAPLRIVWRPEAP